jgi:hypothetical protein
MLPVLQRFGLGFFLMWSIFLILDAYLSYDFALWSVVEMSYFLIHGSIL